MSRWSFDRPRLVLYLTAGLPDEESFLELVGRCVRSGIGVLEVGIPYSDPVADGPVIQAASERALDRGITPPVALKLCRRVRERHPDLPLVAMTYSGVAYAMGDAFTKAVKAADLDGVILADLPVDEADTFPDLKDRLIFLAAPNTPQERIGEIARRTNGFLYLVGRYGTTGGEGELAEETLDALQRTLAVTRSEGTPVGVGFGVSRPDQVRSLVKAGADGVIVGSAVVKLVNEGRMGDAVDLVQRLARGLQG